MIRLSSLIRRAVARLIALVLVTSSLALPSAASKGSRGASEASAPDLSRSGVSEAIGRLPLAFERNEGQAARQVKFLSRVGAGTLHLTSTEAVLTLQRIESTGPLRKGKRAVVRMRAAGASQPAKIEGLDQQPGKSNYFIGSDSGKWRSNVANYGKVRYRGVYPGIDLVYYGNRRQLEYDFVVAPEADPDAIKLRFDGIKKMRVGAEGDLILDTPVGEIRHRKPVVYQMADGEKKLIASEYEIKGRNQVGFKIAAYDRRATLVIDPVLVYSTFLGGEGQDDITSIDVDSSGNAYVAGLTFSDDFPVTEGAFQTARSGYFVTKINASATAIIYSTFIGSSINLATPFGLKVDPEGNAYITGSTTGTYPTTSGSFQPLFGGLRDGFITKLNPSGSALVYSTYLGKRGDDRPTGIEIDAEGDAYVTGHIFANSGFRQEFPVTPGAFQTTYAGGNNPSGGDGFVSKLNSDGTALVFSTLLGGVNDESSNAIAIDIDRNVYVTGVTFSEGFPVTPGAFKTDFEGQSQNFVTKFNPSGSALVYSTFSGGGSKIAVDASGTAYVYGVTTAPGFPTTPGAFQTQLRGLTDFIVTRFNEAGSGLIYSTYLGGSGDEFNAAGMALDAGGNVYLTGQTDSADFPVTPNAFQAVFGGGFYDSFVAKLNPAGSGLVYSSYLGGRDTDDAQALAIDSSGNAYVGGGTASSDFPTTPGVLQPRLNPDASDAFLTKISSFDLCLQDESGSGVIQINPSSGSYQFTNCRDGFALSGAGAVSRRGSLITIQHNASDRRVIIRVDTSTGRATASIQVFSPATTFALVDNNITNNTCGCR